MDVRFQVMLYHPASARELAVSVPLPLEDKVLRACGLGDHGTTNAREVDKAAKEVAAHLMHCVTVHDDGSGFALRDELMAGASDVTSPPKAAKAAAK